MAQLFLSLTGIRLSFGGKPLLDGVELAVSAGERVCLVGRNGTGKSTLLKIAAGDVEADSGLRFVQPDTTLRYLPQEADLSAHATIESFVVSGLGAADDPYKARLLLEELGLDGERSVQNLSGGETRRVSLARALAPEPDVLLLDEPTNHLDLPAIEWLEERLLSLRSAMVIISHDRRFLDRLTNKTVWLDRGAARRMERGFSAFEAWRDEVLAEEERNQALLAQRIAAEEHWMRYGVTARRKRNMRRVDLLSSLRKERKEHVGRMGGVRLEASTAGNSGALVAELKSVSKSFGERKIVSGLDLLVMRGDRLAIVGPNGAGKTTLLNLIAGGLLPDSGTVRRGTSLNVVMLDQSRQSLAPDDQVADVITAGRGSSVTINGETRHVVTYMKDFLFRAEQARSPVSVLSGGERARLILARELAKPSNLLILDEPTNDLDMETLDLLEELLADYKGTILLVSHDRDFIDRLATSVLMHEGNGKWTEYAGGYSDMVAQRGVGVVRPAAAKAALPRAAKPSLPSATPAAKRKLSFKEKHALETLPDRLAALDREIANLSAVLSDAQLFNTDPARFRTSSARLADAQREKTAAEEQWLELEILREELEDATGG